MSNEIRFPAGGREGRDEELARLLAPLYAAPADEAYWNDLHARILRRVRNGAEDGAWWVVLSHWARAGAAAAVLVAALAGALLMQHQATEARMAYEAMLHESPVYSLHMATRPEGSTMPGGTRRAAEELPETVAAPFRDPGEADHLRGRLTVALGTLSDRQRSVIVLHDVQGFKHAEIGDMLGIPEGTARSDLHHARAALRRALGGLRSEL